MIFVCLPQTDARRLEPLSGRERDVQHSKPHEKHRQKIPPSSHAVQTPDRIISMPEPHPKIAQKHPPIQTPREFGDSVDGRNLHLKGTQDRKIASE